MGLLNLFFGGGGSAPSTKSEARERIARLQGEMERLKISRCVDEYKKTRTAEIKSEIARLRAKIPDLPK